MIKLSIILIILIAFNGCFWYNKSSMDYLPKEKNDIYYENDCLSGGYL